MLTFLLFAFAAIVAGDCGDFADLLSCYTSIAACDEEDPCDCFDSNACDGWSCDDGADVDEAQAEACSNEAFACVKAAGTDEDELVSCYCDMFDCIIGGDDDGEDEEDDFDFIGFLENLDLEFDFTELFDDEQVEEYSAFKYDFEEEAMDVSFSLSFTDDLDDADIKEIINDMCEEFFSQLNDAVCEIAELAEYCADDDVPYSGECTYEETVKRADSVEVMITVNGASSVSTFFGLLAVILVALY